MRGLASVLTVAFVFASSAFLLGSTSAQSPDSSRPDGTIHGVVTDQHGAPVAGATLYVSNYGYGGCCYDYSYSYTNSSTGSSDPASSGNDTAGSREASSMPYPSPYPGEMWGQTDGQGKYSIAVRSGDNNLQATKDGYNAAYTYVYVAAGQDVTMDLHMQKLPEKTAHIEGRVVDGKTGTGLRYASLSLQSPEHGVYECSVEAAYAPASPSPSPTSDWEPSGSNTWSGTTSPGVASSSIAYPYPGYSPGCAIIIHPDGSFEGMVTPGYAILSVYYDSYRSCSESHDADGSFTRTCGPEYNSWSGSFDLPAGETTSVRVPLKAKPATDATVSGYLVDAKTGKAIANAQVSFTNEDRSGYGYATTDGDGSYGLRLRSGFHQVYAYADGYFAWQGVVDVKPGATPFDVKMTQGQPSYDGGCCYAYPYPGDGYAKPMSASGGSYAATASAEPQPAGADSPDSASFDDALVEEQAGDGEYEDIGGGLGPYDADERARVLAAADDSAEPEVEEDGDGKSEFVDIPAGGLLLALAALGLVLAATVRRRLH